MMSKELELNALIQERARALRIAQDLDAYHMRAEHKQAAMLLREQHALIQEMLNLLAHIDRCIYTDDNGRAALSNNFDEHLFDFVLKSAEAYE